jgi:glucose/arabinose dehydrogenase
VLGTAILLQVGMSGRRSLPRRPMRAAAVVTLALLAAGPVAAQPAISLVPVAQGLGRIVAVTHAGDGSSRLFLTRQTGEILILEGGAVLPTPFLDISGLVSCCGERGLLSVAFHPDYAENGFFYVDYTDLAGDTVVARYSVSASDPDRADPASGRVILTQDQPFANHNGGQLQFGPDGRLFIALGDGGSADDPQGNGQNRGTLLGKLLRIDVDAGDPYAIPPDNPFVGDPGTRPEIWALGLRNPWRFSFDRVTGDLFVADVGQSSREEVDFEAASPRAAATASRPRSSSTTTHSGARSREATATEGSASRPSPASTSMATSARAAAGAPANPGEGGRLRSSSTRTSRYRPSARTRRGRSTWRAPTDASSASRPGPS